MRRPFRQPSSARASGIASAIERRLEARPVRRRLAAEPGILALGILAGRGPARRQRLLAAQLAVQEGRRSRARRSRASPAQAPAIFAPEVSELPQSLHRKRFSRTARRSARGASRAAAAGSAAPARPPRRSRRPSPPASRLSVRPVERTTSSARAVRGSCRSGRSRAAASRILARQRRMRLADRQRPHRLAHRRVDLRHRRDAVDQGADDRGRCRRPGSAAGPRRCASAIAAFASAAQSAAEQASAPSR